MSTLSYEIEIDGAIYEVEADDGKRSANRGTFYVVTNAGRTVLTDCCGEGANPLHTLWGTPKWYRCRGAARAAMERKAIKDAVLDEIEMHKNYCLELIESGEI